MFIRHIIGKIIESINSLFFASIIIVILSFITILSNESGMRFVAQNLSFLSLGQISIADSSGSLRKNGELHNILINTKDTRIAISSLKWDWQPTKILSAELKINSLEFADVRYENFSPPSPFTPWNKPSNLSPLFFKISIDQLKINKLELFPSDLKFKLLQTQISYGADNNWQIKLQNLISPWGEVIADLAVNSRQPFNSKGEITLLGKFENKPWQSKLNISGDLEKLIINGNNDGIANATLKAELASFATNPFAIIKSLDLRVLDFNPQAHGLSKYNANLTLAAIVEPINNGYQGGVSIINNRSGSLFENKIPLNLLSGSLTLDQEKLFIQNLRLFSNKGEISSNGFISIKEIMLNSEVKGINLAPWISNDKNYSPLKQLNGKISLAGNLSEPLITWNLNSEINQAIKSKDVISLTGELTRKIKPQASYNLNSLQVKLNNEEIFNAQGKIFSAQKQNFNLFAKINKLNPQSIDSFLPVGSISANIDLQGALKPNAQNSIPQLLGRLQFTPSSLAGKNVTGSALINIENNKIQKLNANLNLGGNIILADAFWDLSTNNYNLANNLKLKIDAQQLEVFGKHFAGRVYGDILANGSINQPNLQAQLNIRDLVLPGNVQISRGELNSKIQAHNNYNFAFDLQSEKISLGNFSSSKLLVNAHGDKTFHQFQADSQLIWQQKPYKIAILGEGKLSELQNQPQWTGQIKILDLLTNLKNHPQIKLLQPLQLSISPQQLKTDKIILSALNGQFNINDLQISYLNNSLAIKSQGQVEDIALASLQGIYPLKWNQSLILNGKWNINWQENQTNSNGFFIVERKSGDIILESQSKVNIPLRLLASQINGEINNNNINLIMFAQSKFGQIGGSGKIEVNSNQFVNSNINLNIKAHLAHMALVSLLLDQSYELDGEISSDFQLSNNLAQPKLSGIIEGNNIVYADNFSGIRLNNGQLKAEIIDKKLNLNYLSFTNSTTSYTTTKDGKLLFSGNYLLGEEDLQLNLVFNKYLLINRPQNYLVASGNAELTWNKSGINLQGKINADEGKYLLPDASAPALSSDINVIRNEQINKELTSSTIPFEMNIQADLGNNFVLNGQGLNANLAGKVDLIKQNNKDLAINGEIKIIHGRYKAYGQDLDINNGSLIFSGAYDNPVINLLAKRRISPVGAGVEVSGYLRQAKIKLYADEALDDRDKLSWLVLGRASTGSADDNSGLTAAAGSFIASGINDQIGIFDDISLNQRKIRYHSDGSVSPAEQIFVVGKQINRDLYLGYEYGMNTAKQAAKLIYQFNKFWSAVASIGDQSSQIESRWSWRFD